MKDKNNAQGRKECRMSHSHQGLYYHFTWTTWDKLPLLTPEVKQRVYALIKHKCGEAQADVIAIGGIEDHLHLLVSLPSTICVSDFVQMIKVCSSFSTNKAFGMAISTFRWQLGYGVHTVSPSHLSRVRQYIANQEEHHREGTLWKNCEPQNRAVKPSDK